jgi:hypothetical protein
MTAREHELFGQINVLAETDGLMAQILYAYRHKLMTRDEAFLQGLYSYSLALSSCRTQLMDAEARRPRVYYLSGGNLDVCSPPG